MSNESKCPPEIDELAKARRRVMDAAYQTDVRITKEHKDAMRKHPIHIVENGRELFISMNEMCVPAYDNAKKIVDAMSEREIRDLLITALTTKTLSAYETFINMTRNESQPQHSRGDTKTGQQDSSPAQ